MDTLLDRKEFLNKVMREICRSARTGHIFSMIVFNVYTKYPGDALKKSFAVSIRRRIRVYEEIGLLDKDSIGVLLPHTTVEQAHKLVEDICCAIIPQKMYCSYSVLDRQQICNFMQQSNDAPACTAPAAIFAHSSCANM